MLLVQPQAVQEDAVRLVTMRKKGYTEIYKMKTKKGQQKWKKRKFKKYLNP